MRLHAIYSLFIGLATLSFSSASSRTNVNSRDTPTSCNGSPELCARKYNEITHMGAHNSAFVRDASTGDSIAANQYFPAVKALDDGIRLLQVQVHDLAGTIELCHTSCVLLDAGPLGKWLGGIKTWLDGHPDEVVTLLIVNSDNKPASAIGTLFEAAGLDKYGFSATPNLKSWPTLKSMITANTRLVVFIASVTADPKYPYLLSEFDYVFETPYAVTTATGFNCTLDRPQKQPWSTSATAAIAAGKLPLMNHFRYNTMGSSIMYPAVEYIKTTNSPNTDGTSSSDGTLGWHAQQCASQWNKVNPTFVLVDFYSEGPAIATANKLNSVIPVGSSTSPSSGAGSSGNGGSNSAAATGSTSSTTGNTGGSVGDRQSRDNGVACALLLFIAGALIML